MKFLCMSTRPQAETEVNYEFKGANPRSCGRNAKVKLIDWVFD